MVDLAYDVLVVGCGPAGATAARLASKSGGSVCVVDGRQEIGNPVRCAELAGYGLLGILGQKLPDACVGARPKAGLLIGPKGERVALAGKLAQGLGGLVIHREVFDQHLARLAARDGARIMLKTEARGLLVKDNKVVGARVSSFGREMNIPAGVVIGADGFTSQVGRWAGLDLRIDPADVRVGFQYTIVNCDLEDDTFFLYLGQRRAPGGFAWMVPKGEGTFNVGLMASMERASSTPKDLLDRFVASVAGLKKGNIIRRSAGAQVVAPPLSRPAAPGLLLCGECACRSDGLPGSGVANALASGMLAGAVAGGAVAGSDTGNGPQESYIAHFNERFRDTAASRLALARAMSGMTDGDISKVLGPFDGTQLADMPAPEGLGPVAKGFPGLAKAFARLII